MSVNKGSSKNKFPVRHCGEHGYGCKLKCGFSFGNGFVRSHWSNLERRKENK